ncbi:hypothetical protein PCE1_004592 [Barthelona sp. PCE]
MTVDSLGNSSEEFEFSVSKATDDSSRTVVEFENSISVKCSQTQASIYHELTYTRTFHGRPVEEVIPTSLFGCRDSDDSLDETTCGWKYESNENPIPYSQGKCCSCSPGTIFDFGDKPRGNNDCSLFGTKMTAHCLRFPEDGSKWHAFVIGRSTRVFSVQCDVSYNDLENDVVRVSPTRKTDISRSNDVLLSLHGSLSSYTSPPMLYGQYFLLDTDTNRSLIVPDNMVSLNGNECNKIGVSYSGFYSVGSFCSKVPNECLRNQPDDLHEEDVMRVAGGSAPLYHGDRFGPLSVDKYGLFIEDVENFPSAVLTLEVKADNMKQVINLSPARFKAVNVLNSESEAGEVVDVRFKVLNYGPFTSVYSIALDNCTGESDVDFMEMPRFSIDSGMIKSVYAHFQIGGLAFAQVKCYVVLLNVRATVLDTVFFEASVTDRELTAPTLQPYNGTVIFGNSVCPCLLDPMCYYQHCLGTSFSSALVLICFVVGLLLLCFCCNCCCCFKPLLRILFFLPVLMIKILLKFFCCFRRKRTRYIRVPV